MRFLSFISECISCFRLSFSSDIRGLIKMTRLRANVHLLVTFVCERALNGLWMVVANLWSLKRKLNNQNFFHQPVKRSPWINWLKPHVIIRGKIDWCQALTFYIFIIKGVKSQNTGVLPMNLYEISWQSFTCTRTFDLVMFKKRHNSWQSLRFMLATYLMINLGTSDNHLLSETFFFFWQIVLF